MENVENQDSESLTPSVEPAEEGGEIQPSAQPAEEDAEAAALAQDTQTPCTTCGGNDMSNGEPARAAEPSYVYALGQIEYRFPNLGLEKEFAQVISQMNTAGRRNRQAAQGVLAEAQNRYLARQMCWVFKVEGLETYILQPRDPADFTLLIEAAGRADPGDDDVDVVIGLRGPIASPGVCNGLMVPIVYFEQIYSFDKETLVKSIPKPPKREEEEFHKDAKDFFDEIVQLADNAGGTDEHRALNYLALRYPEIYHEASRQFMRNAALAGVEVRPSRLSLTRNIMDVVFSYAHRQTDVIDKFFVRVDVTDMFPFLVTKLSPFYER